MGGGGRCGVIGGCGRRRVWGDRWVGEKVRVWGDRWVWEEEEGGCGRRRKRRRVWGVARWC